MGYYTSNAAYAYDMQAAPSYVEPAYRGRERAPQSETPSRPRFDVYTGEGRETAAEVSPAFMRVIKVCAVLAILFCVIAAARVTIASATAAELNAAAAVQTELSAEQDASGDLEVMRSVYGDSTRIRDLAAGTLGMVEPESSITLDMRDDAAQAAQADSTATDGTSASAS